MAVCIGVEAAIYHWRKVFPRPIQMSVEANVVSALAGVPAALVGVIFASSGIPDIFILPTILTIIVEWLYLRWRTPRSNSAGAVIGANLVSNLILLVALLAIRQLDRPITL